MDGWMGGWVDGWMHATRLELEGEELLLEAHVDALELLDGNGARVELGFELLRRVSREGGCGGWLLAVGSGSP